jgi:O-Antigen ligase
VHPAAEDRRTDTRRLALAIALSVLAAWVPLPFGSVLPGGVATLEIAAFALLAALALLARSFRPLVPALLPAGAIIFVALLGVVQSRAWPVAFVRAISPQHVVLARQARSILGLGAPAAVPLSLAPDLSQAAALSWAACAALLLLAAWVGVHRVPRRIVGGTIIAAGVFELLYGGARWMTRTATIWGTPVPGSPARLRGTFVNPDHCAVYLELALAIAFAWAWWSWRRAREEISPERRVLFLGPPLVVWLALFAGLAFTGSRAGLVAGVTEAAVQGLLVAASQRRWRLGAVGLLVATVGLGVAATIGVQEAFGRWLATPRPELAWNDRLEVYARTVTLWERFPWVGSGLGTFRDAFPLVQPAEIGGSYSHAHNDYLEALETTGVIGAAALAIGAIAALLILARRLRRSRRSENRAALLAALGALAAVAVHSGFDFGLSTPANSVTLMIIVGCGLGVPCISDGRNRQRVDRAGRDASPGDARDADDVGAGGESDDEVG